jgi:hypothetical protein
MLNACSPPHLLAYSGLIGHYAKRYGSRCWALIYQMETRYRRESMERVRRKASFDLDDAIIKGHSHDFNPAMPWDYVFSKATEDSKYWHLNVEEPALLIVTGSRGTDNFLDGDAPVCMSSSLHLATHGTPGFAFAADAGNRHSKHAVADRRPPASAPPTKRRAIEDKPDAKQHNMTDGKYTTNRSGNALCISFNNGSCVNAKKGNPVCPKEASRRHNCSTCLSAFHGAHECTGAQAQSKGKGKGSKRK